jgi:hypothetical protein
VSSVSPSIFLSVPIQTLREAPKAYLAFRGVGYHFKEDYKPIFFGFNEHRMKGMRKFSGLCQSNSSHANSERFLAVRNVNSAVCRVETVVYVIPNDSRVGRSIAEVT